MEIFKYFDSKGANQIITTNGMNISDDVAAELAKLKHLVCVQVSLNGSGENDNIIRGSPKAFKRTLESIKMLKDAGVVVWIHCVILKENIDDLANVVRLGGELGLRQSFDQFIIYLHNNKRKSIFQSFKEIFHAFIFNPVNFPTIYFNAHLSSPKIISIARFASQLAIMATLGAIKTSSSLESACSS